jgi:mannose-6-phosphate isomerase-like protein (cupin superfamily)
MRTNLLAVTFAITAVVATAQQKGGTPTVKMFTTSAEIQDLMAKSKSQRKEGQAIVTQRILSLAPYNANLEYRGSVGPAAVHEKEAEMFYVIDGSATMITGGKLTEETRPNAENLSGTGITGGDSRNIAKGDFIIVPEGTPHWFSQINGTLVLMSLHVPRPVH